MSDLERLGFVASPHTSAGRVPTPAGYRFFVDSIMKVRPLTEEASNAIREQLDAPASRTVVIGNASELLSQLTHYAGVVLMNRRRQRRLRQVEFLSLSAHRILVILVTEDGEVENRVTSSARGYSESELTAAANCFNELYSGMTLDGLRRALLDDMRRDNLEAGRIIDDAVTMATELFHDDDEPDDLLVSGETNLMELPEFNEIEKLRGIFDAFKAKHNLLDLLDRGIDSEGIRIFIGEESGYEALTECSVVTAPYGVDGQTVGVIGVIGPTRMAYERVVPMVDITARLLSNALSHHAA